MELRGRNAVVTGGAVRMGLAIARKLADEGVNVCIHCNSHAAKVDEVLQELRAKGVQAVAVEANFEQPVSAARAVMSMAIEELGPVSILVNNAAIFEKCSLAELTEDVWDRHLAINLQTPAFLSQEFARRLPEGLEGAIINIVDWRALKPLVGHLPYTVAKAGLVALTRLLAQELAPRIRVNGVAPGAILPPPGAPESALQDLARKNPLQRTGQTADVAGAVAYLLQAGFVNGEILHVTGGEQL